MIQRKAIASAVEISGQFLDCETPMGLALTTSNSYDQVVRRQWPGAAIDLLRYVCTSGIEERHDHHARDGGEGLEGLPIVPGESVLLLSVRTDV